MESKPSLLKRCGFVRYRGRLFATLALLPFLAGCGGGGSSSNGGATSLATTRARGAVQLPSGMTIAPTALTVAAPQASAVSAAGAFEFDKVNGGDSLVVIGGADRKPLLAGFTDSAGSVKIDTTTTAVALLFYGCGAFTLPPDQHTHIRELLAASPAVPPLAATLAQRLAADPNAITDNDSALQSALQTALDTLRGSSAQATSRSGSAAPASASRSGSAVPALASRAAQGAAVAQVTRDAAGITLLLAQPSEPQSGVIVGASDDQTGLQITNTRRRNLLLYITQTGYDDAQGVHHDANLPVRKGDFPGDWIVSTNKLAGVIGSVVDVAVGNGAYQPVKSEIIPLPLKPETATKSYYRVTLAGPGLDPGREPKEDPAAVKNGANGMLALSFTKDIFLPLFFSIMDVHLNLNEVAHPPALFSDSKGLIAIAGASGHVVTGLTNFHPKEVSISIIKAMSDDYVFRQSMLNGVTQLMLHQGVDFGKLLGPDIVLTKLSFVLAILDKGLALGDASVAAADWGQSNYFDEWDITVVPATVRLNPDGATVYNLDTQSLTVTTQIKGNLTYHYTLNGGLGSLVDVKANTGNGTKELNTTSATINYVGDKNPPEGGGVDETVTVEVFRIPDGATAGQKLLVGKSTATLHRKLKKQLDLPTTLAFADYAVKGNSGNLGIFVSFELQQNADNYVFTATSSAHQFDTTYMIKASDIGPDIPGDVWFASPGALGVKPTIIGGFTGGFPISVYRRGNTLFVPMSAVQWGPGTSLPTRDSAIQRIIADNPSVWQYGLKATANF
jgi:hypothetical protein